MGGHEWKKPRKAKREQGGKLREQRELGDKGVEHKGMGKRTPVVAKETDNSYGDKILQGTTAIVIFSSLFLDQKYRQHV